MWNSNGRSTSSPIHKWPRLTQRYKNSITIKGKTEGLYNFKQKKKKGKKKSDFMNFSFRARSEESVRYRRWWGDEDLPYGLRFLPYVSLRLDLPFSMPSSIWLELEKYYYCYFSYSVLFIRCACGCMKKNGVFSWWANWRVVEALWPEEGRSRTNLRLLNWVVEFDPLWCSFEGQITVRHHISWPNLVRVFGSLFCQISIFMGHNRC